MSFCPSKDIHSVYLDGELPENYKAEYELHIKNCPQCQKELARQKALHNLFQNDSKELKLDSKFMEDSFERLKIKMAYAKNTEPQKKSNKKSFTYIISAAAAAAVFAVIIPVRMNPAADAKTTEPVLSAVVPVTSAKKATNVSFDSGRSVLVSGNIEKSDLSSSHKKDNKAALVQNVKDVDLLRPDFEDESISIRITVPGVGETPVVTEVKLPMEFVVSGRF